MSITLLLGGVIIGLIAYYELFRIYWIKGRHVGDLDDKNQVIYALRHTVTNLEAIITKNSSVAKKEDPKSNKKPVRKPRAKNKNANKNTKSKKKPNETK